MKLNSLSIISKVSGPNYYHSPVVNLFCKLLKKMFIFTSLCLWSLAGVFGVDAVKLAPESVMEGDVVTLRTDVTEILQYDPIQWRFGDILIAKINMKENRSIFYNTSAAERFRNRLKLDQTGSLTIMNTRTTDSGLYKVTSSNTDTLNTFSLTVYARLSVPVISSNTSENSSSSSSSGSSVSKCVFLCSVNVSDVTLSWYKGNSLFSSISVSDVSRSLSLSLECLDDSYSCVVSNPISNQTQHLNTTELCQPCSDDFTPPCGSTEAVIRLALSALVGVVTVAMLIYDIRSRSLQQKKRKQTSTSDND